MPQGIIVHCKGCGETWGMDFDPCACTCSSGDENYEDWEIVDPTRIDLKLSSEPVILSSCPPPTPR